MGNVEPFYFRLGPTKVWHKCDFLYRELQKVEAVCGQTTTYARTNRSYQDTEAKPYTGNICKRCEGGYTPTAQPPVSLSIKEVTPEEAFGHDLSAEDVDLDESTAGGMSWELAMAKRPRRSTP